MNVLREANQTVPEELTKFGSHVKKKEHGMYGAFFKVNFGILIFIEIKRRWVLWEKENTWNLIE